MVPHWGSPIRNRRKRHPFGVCKCAQSYVIAWLRNLKACVDFGVRGSWHMMMQSCDSTRLAVNQHAWRSQASGEGHFPLVSVPAGLTVGFQAAGKHILLHSHSGRGIVIFLSFPGFLLMLLSDGGLSAEWQFLLNFQRKPECPQTCLLIALFLGQEQTVQLSCGAAPQSQSFTEAINHG